MSGNGREFEYEDLQFAVGETASQVKVYFKDCEPPGTLGSPGDVYLATIQKKLRLYGRVSDGWKVWAGPSKKDDWYLVFHPHAPDHVLWSNIHRYGWFNTSVAKGSGSSGRACFLSFSNRLWALSLEQSLRTISYRPHRRDGLVPRRNAKRRTPPIRRRSARR